MNQREFKSLWEWCDYADFGQRKLDNAEFWRRFLVAISVYPEHVRMRLVDFMVFMNKED